MLSESDIAALEASTSEAVSFDDISDRMNAFYTSIGPTIDSFADGIHKIGQYRIAADNVAGRVLSICAERLTQREKEGRRRALPGQEAGSPPKDLGGVLRSLSRLDR
jgi:kinetochore protein Mis13/DSN1